MAADTNTSASKSSPVRVVGIGASAGGLEAFSRLFGALPAHTGLAYLLIPHLSPTHPSELTQLMARVAPFPVTQADEGVELQADHLYVLPPDRVLRIEDGHIRLDPRLPRDGVPTVIDACFISLAETWRDRAVGVVLSGNGSDGAAGLKVIKSHGGTTYAQDFYSAAYDSMPRSAVLAGAVDFTLPPEGIADALVRSSGAEPGDRESRGSIDSAASWGLEGDSDLSATDAANLQSILQLLQAGTGVDFQHYKRPGVLRRIRRRMSQLGVTDLRAYRSQVESRPAEVQALFNTVLIHITEFFRDPETFEVLRTTVLPTLFENRPVGAPIRVWVVGCASGEEAYSIAMIFREAEAELGREMPAKIFATDLSEAVLATARLGRYPDEIKADVSPERLERFFLAVNGGYQIQKQLRDMVVFARQDVTRDPPFAQLDLILCRNLLIYLDPALQRRVLHVFHYALDAAGFLTLGPAETVGGMEPLFSPVDRIRRVFLRRPTPSRRPLDFGWSGQHRQLAAATPPEPGPGSGSWTDRELQQRAAAALFQSSTGSVIVNAELLIRHFEGRVGPYLEPAPGSPTAHLLRMAHPDLRLHLGRLIRKAQKERHAVRRAAIRITVGRKVQRVTVSVVPFPTDEAGGGEHYLVQFEPVTGATTAGAEPEGGERSDRDDSRVLQLEQELADTRDYLQTIIDQQDVMHAELQTAFESSRSANEEFQSTNEELESTKEELQSVNEELNTLNEQLQQRNAELTARAAEVGGLLEAMEIPSFLLTPDLRLHAFNAKAGGELGLEHSQVGRPVTELALPLPLADLQDLAEQVLATQSPQEREVQDSRGSWFALRLWPVLAAGGSATAVVAALVDIARLRQNLDHANQARTFSESIVQSVRVPLLVLDRDLRVLTSNQAFRTTFGYETKAVAGALLWDLGEGEWDLAEIRRLLDRVRRTGQGFEGQEVELESPRLGRRIVELAARQVVQPGTGARHVLLAAEDLTGRKKIEQQVISAGRMQAVGQLAGGVAHEINNQMMAVLGFAEFLGRSGKLTEEERTGLGYILKSAGRAADITRQLLAFGRRQTLRPVVTELNALVAAAEGLLVRIVGPELELEVSLGEGVGQVRVDQSQLEQMLVNLVLNARDAMAPGGRVTVETASITVAESTASSETQAYVPRGTYARLVVRDTGSGMDEVTLARIFEPFFTTKPQGLGTGLGLASVYGMVKQSGGFIWVESEPGRGTVFTIDLPNAAAAAPEKTQEPSPVVPRGSETILVVEDEEAVRMWIAKSLSELGYSVLEAGDGAEALRLVASAEPAVSLVMTDVVMGTMGGVELRDRLAKARPWVPVLLMSGHGADELIGRRIVRPEDAVLQKPFDIAELARQIRMRLDAGPTPTS